MRKFQSISLVGLLLFFSLNIHSQSLWQSAYEKIDSALFQGQILSQEIFVFPSPIQAFSSIKTLDSVYSSPATECWFFFIDDNPYANWGHNCRLVFVENGTSNIHISNSLFPPDLSKMIRINSILPKRITEIRDLYKITASRDTNNHTNDYAIIISGGVNNYYNWERYYNDCAAIYSTLRNRYGYQKNHIYVIMSDGIDTTADRHLNNDTYDSSPLDLDGDGVDDIQYAATYENIVTVFNLLASQISRNDNVFIFTTDHGGSSSELFLWNNTSMTKEQFAIEVNKLSIAKSINILMEQCYSGGFIPLLCGDNRVVSTACSSDEVSWAMQNMVYDEFCYHWIAAVNGRDPYGTIVSADQNNDGIVSMAEAFLYAKNADTQYETPQYCSPDCSDLGSYLTLSGIVNQYTNVNITSSTNWYYNVVIDSNIFIDSLATLTISDTLFCAPNSRIIVRPGGALIVNGGTLTNACDGEMWEGIIVEGDVNSRQYASKQGRVILTNATIENARDAISTRGAATATLWDKTGGIVQATATLFRNNRRSAEFLTYENHTSGNVVSDNISHFTRCTFTIDDDNLFAGNDAHFGAHITMYKVRGVKINGCAFRNEVTTTNNSARGNAISTIEAGFKAKRVCPVVSPIDPCGCFSSGSDTVTRCSFTGFHSAISAADSEGNYDITIDNCDFAQNTYGVDMAACDNVRVSFCDFNLDGNKTTYGITFANCTGYTIEGNSFYRTFYSSQMSHGTYIDNSGTEENVIRLNEFSNLKFGCTALNTNGLTGTNIKGLQYNCNSFDGCMNGIYVANTGKVRTVQGSSSAGADNIFGYPAGTGRSITIPASHDTVTYYYSTGNSHLPYGNSRYRLLTAYANSCLSSLCGGSLPPIVSLMQYREVAEELLALHDSVADRTLNTEDAVTADMQMRLANLSAAMGDLSRAAIHAILSDTVVDMELLKEWYRTIAGTSHEMSLQQGQYTDIPVAAYQLAEVYSTEGNYAAAAALLQSLPQQFNPDEAARHEYENYMNLQRLRESVAGRDTSHNVPTANWYRMTGAEIADMQQVAEYDNGRAARMAKEILCFFHHICYEDEPLLPEWDGGAGGRGLYRDAMNRVSTNATGLRIHPNPANTTLTVETDSPVREITVYNLTGQVMMTIENCPSPATINVASLPRGIYLLRAVTDNGVKTARFVKN